MPNARKAFKHCLSTLPLLFLTSLLLAQPKDNSPYSLIGLGENISATLSASGFGGMTAAYADPLHINLQNPAALGSLNVATFEAGLYAEHANLKAGGTTAKAWSGNLSHLALAFPMRNTLNDVLEKRKRTLHWSMGLALLPNTVVGYDIETIRAYPEIDTTTNRFEGTGGTNKLLWSNAVRYKNFSFGVNLGYLFGQLESKRSVYFNDLPLSFSDEFQDNISIRGFLWSVGAQQVVQLESKKKGDEIYTGKALILGVYGNSPTSFNTRSTFLRLRQNETFGFRDTLSISENQKDKGKMPAEVTFGAMYQNPGKFRFGAEYYFGKWSNYENEAKPEELFDSQRIAVGAEYIPDIGSYNNYLKRIRYRVGFYHRSDPRLDDLKQYALTFGIGLPVILPRQQTSFVNFSVELGRYDTSNAIQENFVKMALGFTLNDSSWFFKRKFG